MQRRQFIKSAIAANLLIAVNFILPSAYAKIEREVFKSESADDAMKAILGELKAEESDKITIVAPETAANGASVPVRVTTELEGAQKIALVIVNNPAPLAGEFIFGEGIQANIKTQCKMGKTTDVVALVSAGDKIYTHKIKVNVTAGGC